MGLMQPSTWWNLLQVLRLRRKPPQLLTIRGEEKSYKRIMLFLSCSKVFHVSLTSLFHPHLGAHTRFIILAFRKSSLFKPPELIRAGPLG